MGKRGLFCRTILPRTNDDDDDDGPDEGDHSGSVFAQWWPIWLQFRNPGLPSPPVIKGEQEEKTCTHTFAVAYYPKNKSKPEKEITRTLSICDMCVLCVCHPVLLLLMVFLLLLSLTGGPLLAIE